MFGEKIDYLLLRPLVHARNRGTEEELDRRARNPSFTVADAKAYYEKVNSYFGGRLTVSPELSYLDVGCGMGRLSFGLVRAGARDVTGVEVVPRHVEEAQAIGARLGFTDQPRFILRDIHRWETPRLYDVIIVLGAMEHIHDPDRFLARLPSLMKPSSRVYLSHEPFQSPIGDHLYGFFRVQIPWRGLLFSERALLRLRREYYRPTDPAERFQDVVGGLNQMSYTTFLRYARAAGLAVEYVGINPQLKRFMPAFWVSQILTHFPLLRDYFSITVYAVLKRSG
jgi:2-polyprenyl-3-methyl-5-hydroxy-6-metoxy-1,4-benzoquinol methylase